MVGKNNVSKEQCFLRLKSFEVDQQATNNSSDKISEDGEEGGATPTPPHPPSHGPPTPVAAGPSEGAPVWPAGTAGTTVQKTSG